jgi:hypothetical protein
MRAVFCHVEGKVMNPLVLFLPIYRASTSAYVLGVILLATTDFVRLTYGLPLIPGWLGLIAIWFFVFSLHANRRRHAGESIGLAFLPLMVALLGKMIGSVVGFFPGVYESMRQFAESNGIDTNDTQAFAEAMNEPGFQQAWQTHLESDTELLMAMFEGTAMPSFIGFWLMIAVFAIWFAQMRKTGGTLPAAPSEERSEGESSGDDDGKA